MFSHTTQPSTFVIRTSRPQPKITKELACLPTLFANTKNYFLQKLKYFD